MPSYPSWTAAWASAAESGEPALLLATITHPERETKRFVVNTDEIVSRGETFKPTWMQVGWVQDDGRPPRCSLSLPNVDPELGQFYMRTATRPKVTLEVINATYPDDVLFRVPLLDLVEIKNDTLTITGGLIGRDYSSEPLGSITVLPGNFPALYRAQR
jgi:hypothetical protein